MRLILARWSLTAILIGGLGGALAISAERAPAVAAARPASAQQWQVQAGAESGDRAVQLLQYFPAAITVNVGDTITWTNPTAEIHTITFLAPGQERPEFDRADPQQEQPQGSGQVDGSGYLNSGVLETGKTWTVTAAQPGTYSYVCLVHRQQAGTVVVNSDDAPAGQPQDAAAIARTAADPVIAEWQPRIAAYQPTVRPRPDGSREFVLSGGMGDGAAAVMRFLPTALDVRVGDTVTWDNADVETPHTVTFGPIQGPPPQPWGNPSGFDGNAPLSSGYFGKNWPAGETYSVTFAAPGQFSYICILHAPALMLASINVAP
jgi:plastocyanin